MSQVTALDGGRTRRKRVRGTEKRMLTFSLILCSLSAHFISDKGHLVIFVLFQSDPSGDSPPLPCIRSHTNTQKCIVVLFLL